MTLHEDAKLLTEAQRRRLSEILYCAIVEIRRLGWQGKSEQTADLADAFHNLPQGMWLASFSLRSFRDGYLLAYQEKYPERFADYVAMVDEVMAMQD